MLSFDPIRRCSNSTPSLVYSLRTRPSENQTDGLGDRLGWKCTERNVWNFSSYPLYFLELLAVHGPNKAKLCSNNFSRQQIPLIFCLLKQVVVHVDLQS